MMRMGMGSRDYCMWCSYVCGYSWLWVWTCMYADICDLFLNYFGELVCFSGYLCVWTCLNNVLANWYVVFGSLQVLFFCHCM